VVSDTEDVARHTSASGGENVERAIIINAAEENGLNYCKDLHGKTRFSALYGTYTVTLDKLKAVLKASTLADQTSSLKSNKATKMQEDDFQEVQGWKRHTTNETAELQRKWQYRTKCRPP
jgi:hypothetical protein